VEPTTTPAITLSGASFSNRRVKPPPAENPLAAYGCADQFRMLGVLGELLEGVFHDFEVMQIEVLRAQEREAVQVHELLVPDLLMIVPRVAAGVWPDHQDAADDVQIFGHNQPE